MFFIRRNANRDKANKIMERLQELLQLHQFLQDCEEVGILFFSICSLNDAIRWFPVF